MTDTIVVLLNLMLAAALTLLLIMSILRTDSAKPPRDVKRSKLGEYAAAYVLFKFDHAVRDGK